MLLAAAETRRGEKARERTQACLPAPTRTCVLRRNKTTECRRRCRYPQTEHGLDLLTCTGRTRKSLRRRPRHGFCFSHAARKALKDRFSPSNAASLSRALSKLFTYSEYICVAGSGTYTHTPPYADETKPSGEIDQTPARSALLIVLWYILQDVLASKRGETNNIIPG